MKDGDDSGAQGFSVFELRIVKIICRPCSSRFGLEDATFSRPGDEKLFDLEAWTCPRCKSDETDLKVEVK
jgi:hypothetical protein